VTYAIVAARARVAAGWCVVALGLTIPISTAADGILIALLLIAWLAALPANVGELKALALQTPPTLAALLLFLLLLAGCAYASVPPKESFRTLGKYLDLALIPIFMWAAAHPAVRRRALVLFAIAVIANLYVAYTAAAGLPGLRSPHYPIGFKASVTHSILVSLGAFLFLLYARETRRPGVRVALVAAAALCAHNVLFIVIGRTGYVVLGLLLAYFMVTAVRGWRGPAYALVAVASLAGAAYLTSPSLQQRVDEIGQDLEQYRPGARDNTSVGQRLEYTRNTLAIVAEHPVLGVGTGGFAQAYAERVRGTESRTTTNPHNDYALIAAQVGIPGFALLVALYVLAWHKARALGTRLERDLVRGVTLAIAAGGLVNSLLLDHVEGLLFAWFTGLLYASYRRPAQP